jgi:hypothetical protein
MNANSHWMNAVAFFTGNVNIILRHREISLVVIYHYRGSLKIHFATHAEIKIQSMAAGLWGFSSFGGFATGPWRKIATLESRSVFGL